MGEAREKTGKRRSFYRNYGARGELESGIGGRLRHDFAEIRRGFLHQRIIGTLVNSQNSSTMTNPIPQPIRICHTAHPRGVLGSGEGVWGDS